MRRSAQRYLQHVSGLSECQKSQRINVVFHRGSNWSNASAMTVLGVVVYLLAKAVALLFSLAG
jgi:hypothetical protein